ncbi:hypothetical protein [Flavobacterium silvisoli]|uniref:hypothetical protein n=1 Tax=Flavobacterium silvisoli TaxID=2529433 RepID=UPI0012B5AE97|nr:hypothetical protein [Flavobacterium silvisoli]
MYNPYVREINAKKAIPPSKGVPGGGGGVEGGGGPGAANRGLADKKSTARIRIILFGTIFIVRKSKKKIYSPK